MGDEDVVTAADGDGAVTVPMMSLVARGAALRQSKSACNPAVLTAGPRGGRTLGPRLSGVTSAGRAGVAPPAGGAVPVALLIGTEAAPTFVEKARLRRERMQLEAGCKDAHVAPGARRSVKDERGDGMVMTSRGSFTPRDITSALITPSRPSGAEGSVATEKGLLGHDAPLPTRPEIKAVRFNDGVEEIDTDRMAVEPRAVVPRGRYSKPADRPRPKPKTAGAVPMPQQLKLKAQGAEAEKLLDRFTMMGLAVYIPCLGGPGCKQRATEAEVRSARFAFVLSVSKSSRGRNVRLYLEKFADWQQSQDFDPYAPPFCVPMSTGTAIAFREYCAAHTGMATCAASTENVWAVMTAMGVPTVGNPEAFVLSRPKRNRAGGTIEGGAVPSNAREAPPPKLVVDLERWLHGNAELLKAESPVYLYCMLAWLDLKINSRGCSVVMGVFVMPKPGDKEWTIRFTDKAGKVDTELYGPFGAFYHDRMPTEFAAVQLFATRGFNTPRYVRAKSPKLKGELGYSAMFSKSLEYDKDGAWQCDGQQHAMTQLACVCSFITGMPFKALQAEKLTGTHWMRHLHPAVMSRAQHGSMALDISGDWVPSQRTQDEHKSIAARKKKARPTVDTYRQTWLKTEQMKARNRCMGLIRAALVFHRQQATLGGNTCPVDNDTDSSWIKWATSWDDLIPTVVPKSSPLAQWVGPTFPVD